MNKSKEIAFVLDSYLTSNEKVVEFLEESYISNRTIPTNNFAFKRGRYFILYYNPSKNKYNLTRWSKEYTNSPGCDKEYNLIFAKTVEEFFKIIYEDENKLQKKRTSDERVGTECGAISANISTSVTIGHLSYEARSYKSQSRIRNTKINLSS